MRFVDKLLPIVVDILGEGQRVLQEDYNNIHSSEELVNAHSSVHKRLDAKFGKEFPAISTIHSKLSQIAEHFIKLH